MNSNEQKREKLKNKKKRQFPLENCRFFVIELRNKLHKIHAVKYCYSTRSNDNDSKKRSYIVYAKQYTLIFPTQIAFFIEPTFRFVFHSPFGSFIKKITADKVDCYFFGSPCWARTNDPAVNSRMLYRLS